MRDIDPIFKSDIRPLKRSKAVRWIFQISVTLWWCCKHKFFRESGSKGRDWCGKPCKMCVCIHMCTQREEFFFLRLLHQYGSWELKWGAGSEGMLRKTAGVCWRTSVLQIPCSSPDLFKRVVEISHRTMPYGKASTDATVVQSIFVSFNCMIFFSFLVYEGVNRMCLCSVVGAVPCRVCMKNPYWSITRPWKEAEKQVSLSSLLTSVKAEQNLVSLHL